MTLTHDHSGPSPTEDARRTVQHLYTRHSEDVFSFLRVAWKLTKADAADITQQTFRALLETLAKRQSLQIQHPRAFLFKLAVRQVYATRRRASCRPAVDDDAVLGSLPSENVRDDLESHASLRSEQRLLLRAMRSLNGPVGAGEVGSGDISPLQLLVYLRFWVGLTLAEVAEFFGVTVGVISGRQRRALVLLKQRVDAIAEEEPGYPSTSTTMLSRWRCMLEQEAALERG